MSGKAMGLKARIRNLAKQTEMSAQVVLQNYMFERFLERLSKSEYCDKFILKGGMLIAALVGIGNRATMDMDTTIINYPINDALNKTSEHRESRHIFIDLEKRLDDIEKSEALKKRWLKYTKNYRYAEAITYEDVLKSIRELTQLLP